MIELDAKLLALLAVKVDFRIETLVIVVIGYFGAVQDLPQFRRVTHEQSGIQIAFPALHFRIPMAREK